MSAMLSRNENALNTHLVQVDGAAAFLIARLSDRAAYASGDEYQEIRSLISALRQLTQHVAA